MTMTAVYRRMFFGFVLAGTAVLIGCGGNSPAPVDPMLSGRVGDNCTVYFRRRRFQVTKGAHRAFLSP